MHLDLPLGALISIIRRNHIIALNIRLKPLGLSAAQVPILLYLSRREGVSQEAIARHFHLDKATIARGVQRLEEDAFVCRRVAPDNRRAYGLFLTAKGKEMIGAILRIESAWEEELLADLSPQERDDVIRVLRTLAEHSLTITGAECDCDTS
jgi:MarR family transcriptional regulator, temperature-dependent positive regulator of motility